MLKKTITRLLSVPNVNIFDGCINAIELEYGKPVTNLSDLKKREDKKKKGDIWEKFCQDWLLASDKYKNVWLFQEWIRYCSEKQCIPKGLKSKQDNGIDIIAELEDGTFVAVQCKYRKDMKKVTWNSLSTFIGLCERTGPWVQYIVMTNGSGVTRKVPKSKKDKSICIGTFRGTSRTQWLKMAGLFEEKTVTSDKENGKQEIQDLSNDLESATGVAIQNLMRKYAQPIKTQQMPTLDELRRIRIQKFLNENK
jgi:hypothetical protein